MQHEDQTEVLVVGAGPTGLLTALLLSESGVKVTVIEQESRASVHSYACALHPETLKLLNRIGFGDDVLDLGRRIETVAFYEGKARRAELKYSDLPGDFPFLVILPQSALEQLLEQRLSRDGKVRVKWNHRLSDVQPSGNGVIVSIDKLGQTALGYAVPRWEWAVEKTLRTRASFVVGADGHNSFVRHSLGIECEPAGESERFAVYEFETDANPGSEVRIAFDEATTNVVWPLSNTRCRWSFQLRSSGEQDDFPAKDRGTLVFEQEAMDELIRRDVQKFIQERAPWFGGNIGEIGWSTDVQFEHRLAKRFGADHRWLVGDAAHQTGPVGMQSMNAGLLEAAELAGHLTNILRENGSPNLLETYDRNRRQEWERLLQLQGQPQPGKQADPWTKKYAARILSSIPASGEDFTRLARQLGFD